MLQVLRILNSTRFRASGACVSFVSVQNPVRVVVVPSDFGGEKKKSFFLRFFFFFFLLVECWPSLLMDIRRRRRI